MLSYAEHPAAAERAGIVQRLWSLRGVSPAGAAEPIVSDACVELVFNVGDRFAQRDGRGEFVDQPRAMIVGPTTRPTVVRAGPRVDVFGIRLEPWACRRLGVAAAELRDLVVPLEDVSQAWRHVATHMLDALAARRGWLALAGILPADRVATDSPRVSARPLVRMIRHTREPLTVREIAARAGRTVRAVERAFAEDVGLSPKALLRLVRVHRALRLAADRPPKPWVQIAVQTGFFDQAHLVREFRELVGMRPSEYRPDPASLTHTFAESSAGA